jgi:hypothetical protein
MGTQGSLCYFRDAEGAFSKTAVAWSCSPGCKNWTRVLAGPVCSTVSASAFSTAPGPDPSVSNSKPRGFSIRRVSLWLPGHRPPSRCLYRRPLFPPIRAASSRLWSRFAAGASAPAREATGYLRRKVSPESAIVAFTIRRFGPSSM